MTADPPAVEFHILPAGTLPLPYACRLIEHLYHARCTVQVQAADETQARTLDDALWSFRAGSFVPHRLRGSTGDAPVWIAWPGAAGENNGEVLVNLADAVPEGFAGFARIAELVPADPDGRAAARARYRHYRERGHTLTEHRPEASAPSSQD